MRTAAEITLASIIGAISAAWFAIGLISPLTPSAGVPSTIELLIFVGAPLVLLISGVTALRLGILRLLLATEATTVLGFSLYLLLMQCNAI